MKYPCLILITLLTLPAFIAEAQKLPAIQQVSLRAAADVKIDGKALELNDTFQALNHNCDIYYTMSNDDTNLYLTIQVTYPDVIRRILNGGITFSVSPSGKKSDKQLMSVTYPVFSSPVGVNLSRKPQSDKEADSLINAFNKRVKANWKTIKTSGIKGVDTTISIYNDDGIQAASAFNNKLAYTCELSVALKHFELNTDHPAKFAYHIMINEVTQRGIDIKKDAAGNIMSINVNKGAVMGQPATDFWGEYTLAKK
jgi:hypothetical protein